MPLRMGTRPSGGGRAQSTEQRQGTARVLFVQVIGPSTRDSGHSTELMAPTHNVDNSVDNPTSCVHDSVDSQWKEGRTGRLATSPRRVPHELWEVGMPSRTEAVADNPGTGPARGKLPTVPVSETGKATQ